MINTNKLTISSVEKITMISNFSTLLSSGISILESIDSLLEDAKGNQKKILDTLRADLVQGIHVHESFAKFPNVFDKVTISIIKASEEAGSLDTTLKDLRDNIKKESEFANKVMSALTYPILIMIVFMGVLSMILVFVIPKISIVFSRLKVDLPLPTKIMIFVSNIVLQYTIPFAIGSISIIIGFILL